MGFVCAMRPIIEDYIVPLPREPGRPKAERDVCTLLIRREASV